jgi:hypothetical protein
VEVAAMQWDLGWQGVGLLVVMALAFGLIVRLLAGGAAGRWLWLIAAAASFVGGLLTSEAWFGWATEEELQPNIDGVSFDEVLLMNIVLAVVIIGIARYVYRRRRGRSTVMARDAGKARSPVARRVGPR